MLWNEHQHSTAGATLFASSNPKNEHYGRKQNMALLTPVPNAEEHCLSLFCTEQSVTNLFVSLLLFSIVKICFLPPTKKTSYLDYILFTWHFLILPVLFSQMDRLNASLHMPVFSASRRATNCLPRFSHDSPVNNSTTEHLSSFCVSVTFLPLIHVIISHLLSSM